MSRNLFIALFLLTSFLSFAQPSRRDTPTCERVVADFYGWYVPLTQKELKEPSFDIAIREKQSVFTPALLLALRADAKARSKAIGEIVGIDFDPFVGGQDPADHYDIRNVKLKGKSCFAEIWRNSPNDTSAKSKLPDAVAELSQVTGEWKFANILYPDVNANLVSVLALLRKDRGEK